MVKASEDDGPLTERLLSPGKTKVTVRLFWCYMVNVQAALETSAHRVLLVIMCFF